jgi:lipid II:glycine glycyltransferase (peptidoglycan interpeptide bridge formation enzyme)
MHYSLSYAIPPAAWDGFNATHPDGHTLQSADWGQFKSEFGWQQQIIGVVDPSGQVVAGALILYKRVHRLLPVSVAYIPAGPLLPIEGTPDAAEARAALWRGIDSAARRNAAAFLKVEPCDWYRERPGLEALLRSNGFIQSRQTIQPPRTVVIDLDRAEDQILKGMNQSTRYKARIGPKKEVETRIGTAADLASFAALMGTTGQRDGFSVHEPAYYARAYQLFAPSGRCALILASYQGRDLAAVMVFRHGDKAYYLYGASSNEERDRMPTYVVQWAAIRWALAQGAKYYDFWGVPDAAPEVLEAEFEKRRDGLWGVYGFKRGWGGRVVRSVGAWDKVYIGPAYALYLRLRAAD